MTTPRSSASRATAGVGSTPATTAAPPAETTPRAKASSSSTPDARVSRPMKTLPAAIHSAAARPSRSTSSGVTSSPTTPRTPSVPKYLRAMTAPAYAAGRALCAAMGAPPTAASTGFAGARTVRVARCRKGGSRGGNRRFPAVPSLTLRELRGLAGLVQAGLLALHLARVAREEALALQRYAQLRVHLDERAGDPVPDRSGLTARAAAVDADAEVVLAVEARGLERSHRDRAVQQAREVLLDRAAVHPRLPVAGAQDDARDGGFALARTEILRGRRHQAIASSCLGSCASCG